MSEHKCPNAFYRGTEIFCRKTDDSCGNVKYCRMAGKWKLTEWAERCPVRAREDGETVKTVSYGTW